MRGEYGQDVVHASGAEPTERDAVRRRLRTEAGRAAALMGGDGVVWRGGLAGEQGGHGNNLLAVADAWHGALLSGNGRAGVCCARAGPGGVRAMDVVKMDLLQELIALVGDSPERVAVEARKALVLELLRMGEISQGKAGEFLGLDRRGVLDLMAEHNIESGPATIEALEREVDQVDGFMRERGQ